MTQLISQCSVCRHFDPSRRDGDFCTAYPTGTGIPQAIVLNQLDHTRPISGDHGVQWAPREPGVTHPPCGRGAKL